MRCVSEEMDGVSEVVIDEDAVFKYILIELTEKTKQGKPDRKKTVVRGYAWAEYHADILDRESPKYHGLGLDYECVGGGRIKHNSREKKIKIYGYSVGFGQANHKLAADILQRHFADYPEKNITWSNSGY